VSSILPELDIERRVGTAKYERNFNTLIGKEEAGFTADIAAAHHDDLLSGYFCPESTSRQVKTFLLFTPGISGIKGDEPTATITESGANFFTAAGLAALLNTTFTPAFATWDFHVT